MTIHRPGKPGDLPSGEALWARWALLAAVAATTEQEQRASGYRTGLWIDDEGLHHDDSGCTWWTMSRMGEGRFVLYGEDESSGVKWHKPSIDMLAGGPDWLPYEELRDRLQGYELGCVYWYENGAWARAPYPEDLSDDGLDCGMSDFVDRSQVLGELSCHLDDTLAGPNADSLLAAAEEHRLEPELLLERLLPLDPDREPRDLPAVARALALACLPGSSDLLDEGGAEPMTLKEGQRVRLTVELELSGQLTTAADSPAGEPGAVVGLLRLAAGTEGTVEEVREDRQESHEVREYLRLKSLLDDFGHQMPPGSRTQLEEQIGALEPAWIAYRDGGIPVRVRVRLDNGFVLHDTSGDLFAPA